MWQVTPVLSVQVQTPARSAALAIGGWETTAVLPPPPTGLPAPSTPGSAQLQRGNLRVRAACNDLRLAHTLPGNFPATP